MFLKGPGLANPEFIFPYNAHKIMKCHIFFPSHSDPVLNKGALL